MKDQSAKELAVRMACFSFAKRALLEKRLQKKIVGAPANTIRRHHNRNTSPLSFGQQRLWFADKFEPNSPLYNICKVFRLQGSLNANALQKALEIIVERHEVLRTNFREKDTV